MNIGTLTELQLDALREVGNIGAGHAATALSQMVDRPIALTVPELEVVDLQDLVGVFGGPQRLVTAVYARLLGDISGGVLFMAERSTALKLVDMLHGDPVDTCKSLLHDEEALLKHVASLIISAYLAAVARMAGINVLPSNPALAFDMAGALLEAIAVEIGMHAEKAFFVRTSFVDEDESVDAALFFLPDPQSLAVILGRIGMV